MNHFLHLRNTLVFGSISALVVACGTGGSGDNLAVSSAQLGTQGVPNDADHGCNVTLRDLHTNTNSDGSLQTNCVDGTCWVVWTGDVDISATASNEEDVPYLYYQSGTDPTWRAVSGVPALGAGVGMQRYTINLTTNTAVAGSTYPTIQVIPYLQTVVGTRLFDHNASVNNYELSSLNSWNIGYAGTTCWAAPPPGVATLSFANGWSQTETGSLVQGGKLAIEYDLQRMPQCFSASTDGVSAWNTEAYVRFSPNGEQFSGSVKGTLDATTDKWQSRLFEIDTPTDATSAAVWFQTSGEGCTQSWDSDFGQNYNYAVSAPQF